MAKEKKRGFFSWLGFGQKEQTPEKETEIPAADVTHADSGSSTGGDSGASSGDLVR